MSDTTEQIESARHKTHRAIELLDTLRRLGGSARTSHLADTMQVSEETVRRTIKKLSRDGLVSRVHGGVYISGSAAVSPFHRRLSQRSREKHQMGRLVASLVKDGTSLFLDVGSTSVFVAEQLRDKHDLLVVTNSLSIAQTLINHHDNRVFLAGGELDNDVGGTFGAATEDYVSSFRVDLAILSTAAVDPVLGFLLVEKNEAELARIFVSHARKSIMVADHSKANQGAPMLACNPDDIDIFVTDVSPGTEIADALKSWDIEIIVAPSRKNQKK